MKNLKVLLSAFAIIAIVGVAFAFKSKPAAYSNANVYCLSSCSSGSLVDFTPDNVFGSFTDVCGKSSGVEIQEYQFQGSPLTCQPIALGQKYDQTIH